MSTAERSSASASSHAPKVLKNCSTAPGAPASNGWAPQADLRVLLDRVAHQPVNRIGELAPWNLHPDAT